MEPEFLLRQDTSWLQLSLQLSAPWSPDSASSMLWAVKLGQDFEGYTVYDIP